MAFPLSKKFLEKLKEGRPEDSYRDAYISIDDEDKPDPMVCIDGWFSLEEIQKILDGIVEEGIKEEEDRNESLGAYPFEM